MQKRQNCGRFAYLSPHDDFSVRQYPGQISAARGVNGSGNGVIARGPIRIRPHAIPIAIQRRNMRAAHGVIVPDSDDVIRKVIRNQRRLMGYAIISLRHLPSPDQIGLVNAGRRADRMILSSTLSIPVVIVPG